MVGASVSYRSKKVLKESRVPSYPRKVSIRSKVCSNFWYTKSERGINWQKKKGQKCQEKKLAGEWCPMASKKHHWASRYERRLDADIRYKWTINKNSVR